MGGKDAQDQMRTQTDDDFRLSLSAALIVLSPPFRHGMTSPPPLFSSPAASSCFFSWRIQSTWPSFLGEGTGDETSSHCHLLPTTGAGPLCPSFASVGVGGAGGTWKRAALQDLEVQLRIILAGREESRLELSKFRMPSSSPWF